MPLPETGLSHDAVLERLTELKADDMDWSQNKFGGYVYITDSDILELQKTAHNMFGTETTSRQDLFPSLGTMERDLVSIAAELLGGNSAVAGNVTSGGTESNLLAVKTARDHARAERDIDDPEIVLPETAHPSFSRAADYFGLTEIRTPVGSDWRAAVQPLEDALSDDTVLVVGSAPTAPHGVIDPIREMATLARDHDAALHVDACLGGFILPFFRKLGRDIPAFDFSIPGVTSISADNHKFGYAHKGASTILYRNRDLRAFQHETYDWPGGTYESTTIRGTRSGGEIAAAWAVLQYLGEAGYLERAETIAEATETLKQAVADRPELAVVGEPRSNVFATESVTDDVRIDALHAELRNRGWFIAGGEDRDPPALRVIVTHTITNVVDDLIADLNESIAATTPE